MMMEDHPFPLNDALMENPPKIFGGVKYCVGGDVDSKILKLLNNGGGKLLHYPTFSATHMIVGEGVDEAKLEDANEIFSIPCLEARWVVFSAMAGKLLPYHGFEAQLNKLFSQVVFTSSGIKGEDLSILWGLLTYHGGRFLKHLTPKTTHLFTHSTESKMYQAAKKHGIKVVCLDWATDCINAGSLVDEKKYDPQFLIAEVEAVKPARSIAVKVTQPSSSMSETLAPRALTSAVIAVRPQAPTSIRIVRLPDNQQINALRGRAVAIRQRIFQPRELLVQGGPIQVRTPTVVTTQQQHERKSLHLPLESSLIITTDSAVAQDQIPSTVVKPISTPPVLTGTQKRVKSEESQSAPPDFPPENQEQQASAGKSEEVANVQETPQSSEQQVQNVSPLGQASPAAPSAAPLRTQSTSLAAISKPNLPFYGYEPSFKVPSNGFLIGCVFWAAQVIENPSWQQCVLFYGGEIVPEYDPARVTHVLCRNQRFPELKQVLRDGKRLVTMYWLSDTCSRKVMAPPFYAMHLPPPFKERRLPLKGQNFSQTGFEGQDRERVKNMVELLGANYTPYFSKLNHGLVAARSEGEKFAKAQEWEIPVVNVQFLNELLIRKSSARRMKKDPKYHQYSIQQPFQIDISLVADLMDAWKTPIRIANEVVEKFEAGKRTLEKAEEEAEKAKRQKISEDEVLQLSYFDDLSSEPMDVDKKDDDTEARPPPVVMFSGFTEKFMTLATKKLKKLGACFTEDVKEATHLVTWEICTPRLYSAVCRVNHIVGAAWVRDSCKAKRFVDEEGYAASIPRFETFHNVRIPDILKKPDRHVLFKGMTFYFTPGVEVAVRRGLEEIIDAAGGQVDKSKRSMTDVKTKAKKNPQKYLIITTMKDFEYFNAFFCTEPSLSIFTVLFIYTCIAEQKVDLDIQGAAKVEPANSE